MKEFEQVLEVVKGEKYYWQITNKIVKKYLKKYGFIEPLFETFIMFKKQKVNDKTEKLKEFIYGNGNAKDIIYVPENYDTYNVLKKIMPYGHIISLQYIVYNEYTIININESIPVVLTSVFYNDNLYKCEFNDDNSIGINKFRYNFLKLLKCNDNIYLSTLTYLIHTLINQICCGKIDLQESFDSCPAISIFNARPIRKEVTRPGRKRPQIKEIFADDDRVNDDVVKIISETIKLPPKLFKWNNEIVELFDNNIDLLVSSLFTYIINKCGHTLLTSHDYIRGRIPKKISLSNCQKSYCIQSNSCMHTITISNCFVNLKHLSIYRAKNQNDNDSYYSLNVIN